MEKPYRTYCYVFVVGFDELKAVQTNTKLPQILAGLSQQMPPYPNNKPSLWTLDSLFLLPQTRLRYYKKLYARLLRSTIPGRSEYLLLLRAVTLLNTLCDLAHNRPRIRVFDLEATSPGMIKKRTPFTDLLESEEQFVARMGTIVQVLRYECGIRDR